MPCALATLFSRSWLVVRLAFSVPATMRSIERNCSAAETTWSRLVSRPEAGRRRTAAVFHRICFPCPTKLLRRRSLFALGTIHASQQRVGHHSRPSKAVLRWLHRACVRGIRMRYSCGAKFMGPLVMPTGQYLLMENVIASSDRPNSAGSVEAPIASLFALVRQWRRATDRHR